MLHEPNLGLFGTTVPKMEAPSRLSLVRVVGRWWSNTILISKRRISLAYLWRRATDVNSWSSEGQLLSSEGQMAVYVADLEYGLIFLITFSFSYSSLAWDQSILDNLLESAQSVGFHLGFWFYMLSFDDAPFFFYLFNLWPTNSCNGKGWWYFLSLIVLGWPFLA